jgi:hypothetical protein
MREDLLKREVKVWLKEEWICFVQPSIGSTIGVADMCVLVPGLGLPLPVELKVAEILPGWESEMLRVPDGEGSCTFSIVEGKPERLRPSYMRPAQISWHDTLQRAGGKSRFLFGMYDGSWNAWILDDCRLETLKDWKTGLDFKLLTRVVTKGKFDKGAWWRGLVPDKA